VVATLTLSTTLNAQRPLDRTKGLVLGIHTIDATGLTVSGADMEGDLTTSVGRRASAARGSDALNGEYDMSGRSS
jgi:hypothetical protein